MNENKQVLFSHKLKYSEKEISTQKGEKANYNREKFALKRRFFCGFLKIL